MVGLGGDAFTLVGGLLLAWDTVEKEEEVKKIEKIMGTLKAMTGLRVEIFGVAVKNEQDVVRAFIRRSARKAVWGCGLLAIGFLLLVASRLMEI
jgi:uncharacterized membrane protein